MARKTCLNYRVKDPYMATETITETVIETETETVTETEPETENVI